MGIKALCNHIKYLEHQKRDTFEVNRMRQQLKINNFNFKEKEKHLISQMQQSRNETLHLEKEINVLHSENKQKDVIEQQCSKMSDFIFRMENEFAKREKSAQDKADKYRAKYESVRQQVKMLEFQKSEYTKVNMKLCQQKNRFCGIIAELQQKLKNAKKVNNNKHLFEEYKDCQNRMNDQIMDEQKMNHQQFTLEEEFFRSRMSQTIPASLAMIDIKPVHNL